MNTLTSSRSPALPAEFEARAVQMRRAFRYLRQAEGRPGAQAALLAALERAHRQNHQLFGFEQAETLRAWVWADVMEADIPVAEASESDMAQFIAAGGAAAAADDPYADDSGVSREHV